LSRRGIDNGEKETRGNSMYKLTETRIMQLNELQKSVVPEATH
jgi:hypothetical protein